MEQPYVVNDILIAQADVDTDQIGRFDIVVNTDTNSIESYKWQCIPITDKYCPVDEQIENLIRKYKSVTDQKYTRVITRFSCPLTHPQRNTETALGNLFADIFKNSLGIDIMLLGSGSIRGEKLGPIVEYGGLAEIFPYDDGVYMLRADGRTFRQMMRYLLRDDAFLGTTEFYQLSQGLKLAYSRSNREIISLTYRGIEIADDDIFTIGLQNYHYCNLESFFGVSFEHVKTFGTPKMIATSCLDILAEYLNSHKAVRQDVEWRLTILD